ncbi:hypothetical protein M8C21_020048 [Ambrosia artemisiifolia]|uniref:Retrotransposon Copia-like N-terminal domain-containing protein n=1 Tax=Ambrosia artemisiifolia TaxID=4212 RepID=A0AAD5CW61_AMBAR|nr:hypothetical protein M8C21_020048 [Ambrosia artemisiifolia]
MQASNINVSNFVSVKLSGRSNYKIWKAQLLCLIESQLLLHIIDAQNQFPMDKGVHMIAQYDKLVKGWIFGSVNEKVLNDLVDLGTAQMVWMKLDSLFNLPLSDTEGDSSNAPDVSTIDAIAPVISTMREDLKYLQALNVDVSNFVSENLVGKINYHTWKTDMLFLIESHELVHIIHAEARFPQDKADPLTKKYDSLVRGWLLSTMNDTQSDEFRMYRSVQEMWKRLESTFTYQPKTSDSVKKDTGDTKDDSSNETKDLNYMHLKSNVNVSSFVSVKLSDHSNYNIWRDQMLSLLESHCLLHTIQICFPWDKDDPVTQKYDILVRDWILSTMNEEQRRKYAMYGLVQLMWRNIELTFDETEDLKYMEASNVNVSNFVSVKLSGRSNYKIWKDQMVCLLESHNLLHIIHMEGFGWDEDGPMTQKYGNLVRGWILSTMNDEECHKYRIYRSVKLMWSNIESTFGETEDLKYMEASNVNLSNFVLVNLTSDNNYSIWRAQILYLLESHSLLHIITLENWFEEPKYQTLVKGWILCTMNDKLLKEFPAEDYVYRSAKELCEKVESRFTKGYPSHEPVLSASTQDLKYTQALNVNASNFVSVKLFGRSNYKIWKGQMLCLIKSQRLLHIIDKEMFMKWVNMTPLSQVGFSVP